MESKNTAAEVGVKLVLDSNAKAETDKIKSGLNKVNEHAGHSAESWKSKIGEGVKKLVEMTGVGLAFEAGRMGMEKIVEIGHEASEVFQEANRHVGEIAGALMMVDQKSNSFKNLKELGWDVKDSMEEIGIKAGVSGDAAVQAFNKIMERGGRTIEQTTELVEKMAYAGKVIPGGLDSITQGFAMIEMGVVRARNPLVQVISATGILKGNAKAVAAQMMKMTPEKQMALAEKALEKMGGKMKDLPLSLAGMKQGIAIITDKAMESIGKPIVAALNGPFNKIRSWFVDNQELIYETGAKFGEAISKAADVAMPFLEVGEKVVRESWNTIDQAMESMFGPGMDLFSYIYENKDAFAQTFGDILRLMITVGSFIVKVFTGVRDSVLGMLKSIGKSGILGGDLAKFIGQEEQTNQTADMRKQIQKKGGLSNDDYDKRRAAFLESAKSSGMNVEDASSQFDKAYRRAMDDHLAVMNEVEGARDAALNDDAKKYALLYDKAAKENDVAAMQYVAKFLEGNMSLQNALAKEGPEIFKSGLEGFLTTLKGMGDKDTADSLRKAMKPSLGTPSKSAITQNFNGPINVKQDFRDQDPDRIAIVFKREMGKMGQNRLQSRLAAPFGF